MPATMSTLNSRNDTMTDESLYPGLNRAVQNNKDSSITEPNNNLLESSMEKNKNIHLAHGKTEEKLSEVKKMSNNIIYWRDPVKTGVIFGAIMAYLMCLSIFPAISVAAYTGLFFITGMMALRLFITIKALTHKTDERHPFKPYLEKNLKVQSERIHRQVDSISKHIQTFFDHLQRVILVENFFATLKFAILLWALTYIGNYLSTLTFVMLGVIAIFTLPKLYESFKTQIDRYYEVILSKVNHAEELLHERLHQLKKKVHHHVE